MMGTEPRLIDANALNDVIEHIDWYHVVVRGVLAKGANSQLHTPLYKADDIYKALDEAPTVDAVEVVHGRWLYEEEPDENNNVQAHCSVCFAGDLHSTSLTNKVPYCWKCGAKMDGGNGNE